MKKTEPIFELLKSIRMEAEKDRDWDLLRAVQKAENVAMEEICGVSLNRAIAPKAKSQGVLVEWPNKFLQT